MTHPDMLASSPTPPTGAPAGTGSVELVSAGIVSYGLRPFGLERHLVKALKLFTDPTFIGKVPDVTGPFVNPPDHGPVLLVEWGRPPNLWTDSGGGCPCILATQRDTRTATCLPAQRC